MMPWGSRIMGDYATTAAMETFTASNNDRHPTELAVVFRCRDIRPPRPGQANGPITLQRVVAARARRAKHYLRHDVV
jgi:hypothetical protein